MNKSMWRWLLFGGAAAAVITYVLMRGQVTAANERAEALQNVVTEKESTLLGYTSYTKYLSEGKQRVSSQARFLAATVGRQTAVTQVINASVLGLNSTGTVAIWYSVEYSYGFDLAADRYDIKVGDAGIEIHVGPPRLVATPAMTNLKYEVLSGGLLTDEKAAALKLFAEAAKRARIRGAQLASEPAIVALCEKQLVSFLRDFLLKQPGVQVVPTIAVVYR